MPSDDEASDFRVHIGDAALTAMDAIDTASLAAVDEMVTATRAALNALTPAVPHKMAVGMLLGAVVEACFPDPPG